MTSTADVGACASVGGFRNLQQHSSAWYRAEQTEVYALHVRCQRTFSSEGLVCVPRVRSLQVPDYIISDRNSVKNHLCMRMVRL
jgi:hypothetical protein